MNYSVHTFDFCQHLEAVNNHSSARGVKAVSTWDKKPKRPAHLNDTVHVNTPTPAMSSKRWHEYHLTIYNTT